MNYLVIASGQGVGGVVVGDLYRTAEDAVAGGRSHCGKHPLLTEFSVMEFCEYGVNHGIVFGPVIIAKEVT